MKKVSGNGCEYVKCSDWTGTSCAYEGPICKYREDAELLASKDQTISDLRAELALCETTHANLNNEYHALKKKMEEKDRDINHLWQRDSVWRGKKEMLENDLAKAWKQLARYREFIKKLADVKHEPDKLLCLLEREALKAVEGEDARL